MSTAAGPPGLAAPGVAAAAGRLGGARPRTVAPPSGGGAPLRVDGGGGGMLRPGGGMLVRLGGGRELRGGGNAPPGACNPSSVFWGDGAPLLSSGAVPPEDAARVA